jgi:two-component system, cell cycle response regulator DivK
MTILLVEDNRMNRDMLTKRLVKRGYEVSAAESGEEALEKVRTAPPGLILLDLGLPGISGLEVARRLKGAEGTRRIPIIALTAHAMAADRDEALAAGCDDFDTKPVEFPRLLAKIQTLLGAGV